MRSIESVSAKFFVIVQSALGWQSVKQMGSPIPSGGAFEQLTSAQTPSLR